MTETSTTHPEYLQHHFVDEEQQRESAKMGMWIFLLTEILLFGGLFVAYGIYRAWHPEMFYNAHKFLDVTLGTVNTIVLITSSLTMALAIRMMQVNKKGLTIINLILTLAFAFAFLVIKYFEYSHKIELDNYREICTHLPVLKARTHIYFSVSIL